MSVQQTKFYIIFEEGRKRYEKKSGQRLDITLSARYVERENDKFAAFRDKNRNIYERLTVAFTPVERLGHIVGAASSVGFLPAGTCLGAAALLIKSAQNVSAYYDRIVELFDVLAGILDRFELHYLDRTSSQIEENFANVFATILEMLGYSTKAIMCKRWKEYFAGLLQGDDQKMEQLRMRLGRLVRDRTSLVVEQIHTAVNYTDDRTRDIIGHKSKIIGGMEDTNRSLMDLLQKQHETKRDNDLYAILRPARSNTDKMEAILRDRDSGTGNWLLAEPAFVSWLRQEEPLLWICGSPGCGKTFLASPIISLIQSNISGKTGQWPSK